MIGNIIAVVLYVLGAIMAYEFYKIDNEKELVDLSKLEGLNDADANTVSTLSLVITAAIWPVNEVYNIYKTLEMKYFPPKGGVE